MVNEAAIAFMAIGSCVGVYIAAETVARHHLAAIKRRIKDLEAANKNLNRRLAEWEDEHGACDGGEWAEGLAEDLTKQLRIAHDLMKRGEVKDARHELERAIEELATVPAVSV